MLKIETSEKGVKITLAGKIATICNDMCNAIADVHSALCEADPEDAQIFRIVVGSLVGTGELWEKREPKGVKEENEE